MTRAGTRNVGMHAIHASHPRICRGHTIPRRCPDLVSSLALRLASFPPQHPHIGPPLSSPVGLSSDHGPGHRRQVAAAPTTVWKTIVGERSGSLLDSGCSGAGHFSTHSRHSAVPMARMSCSQCMSPPSPAIALLQGSLGRPAST